MGWQGPAMSEPEPTAPTWTAEGVTVTSLVSRSVKEVWPTEPGYFTPWLLAHSEVLSRAIGVDVQLRAREHLVGAYSLDLIGTEVENPDRTVIVENQYGPTDHRHLGQLLTYAGGTDPTTVVWIAEDFRDEHRAALDWLNAQAGEHVKFFGLRLTVVSVEGAPQHLVAPRLQLVVQPNDWVVGTKQAVEGGQGLSAKQLTYRAYWTALETEVQKRGWTAGHAPAENWWNFSAGISGAGWGLNFSLAGARVELFLGDKDPAVNLRRWTALREHAATIDAALPEPVVFDELSGKKGCRVEVVLAGTSVDAEDSWADHQTWMLDRLTMLRAVVDQVGGISA